MPTRHRTGLISGTPSFPGLLISAFLVAGLGAGLLSGLVAGPAHAKALAIERTIGKSAPISAARPVDAPFAIEADVALRRAARVKRGDTLMRLLARNKVARSDADAVIRTLRPVYDLRRMRIGQEFTLMFGPRKNVGASDKKPGGQARVFVGLGFRPKVDQEISVALTTTGYKATVRDRPLARGDGYSQGQITSNLYDAAVNAQLPIPVLMDLIRLFSFDVDFQREIQPGDAFEVMYDELRDDRGEIVRSDHIRYAAMILGGKRLEYFRHEPASGLPGYYGPDGQSVRKTLMRTPIDGARLSSRYGRRRHPVSGYTKMHRGVDFAAPRGVPIMAAGDGVIEKIGRWNAYGKYVRIRHNGTFKTAYAHMHRFAKGMRRGRRVKQGEIIGYVGSTGRSTGPHLHYEVLRNGRQTNPMKVKLPSGMRLKGKALKNFSAALPTVAQRVAQFRETTRFASD